MTDQFDIRNPKEYGIVHWKSGAVDNLENYLGTAAKPGWNQTYPAEFAMLLKFIGGQQAALVGWLLTNKDPRNLINSSVEDIAKKSGVSKSTVARTMKALQAADFIRRVRNSQYMVNPRLLCRAGRTYQWLSKEWDKLNEHS